ncbi:MAG: hypothetical protein JW940_34595 [Polyangiaceae bacterium]|nr:hypothetical protein [Polyangiaceae bacterium]
MKRLVALLLAASCLFGCERVAHDSTDTRSADPSPGEGSAPRAGIPNAAAHSQCVGTTAALPVAALTIEWQHEQTPDSMVLVSNGEVERSHRVVARVLGRCLLDRRGEVVLSVDERGNISDKKRQRVGSFQRARELRTESGPLVPEVEALVFQDGAVSAVTDDGAVYYARPGEQAVSMPAAVKGPVARARRTTLLLLELRSGFVTGQR